MNRLRSLSDKDEKPKEKVGLSSHLKPESNDSIFRILQDEIESIRGKSIEIETKVKRSLSDFVDAANSVKQDILSHKTTSADEIKALKASVGSVADKVDSYIASLSKETMGDVEARVIGIVNKSIDEVKASVSDLKANADMVVPQIESDALNARFKTLEDLIGKIPKDVLEYGSQLFISNNKKSLGAFTQIDFQNGTNTTAAVTRSSNGVVVKINATSGSTIGGSIASGQVAFGDTTANTIKGTPNFTYTPATGVFQMYDATHSMPAVQIGSNAWTADDYSNHPITIGQYRYTGDVNAPYGIQDNWLYGQQDGYPYFFYADGPGGGTLYFGDLYNHYGGGLISIGTGNISMTAPQGLTTAISGSQFLINSNSGLIFSVDGSTGLVSTLNNVMDDGSGNAWVYGRHIIGNSGIAQAQQEIFTTMDSFKEYPLAATFYVVTTPITVSSVYGQYADQSTGLTQYFDDDGTGNLVSLYDSHIVGTINYATGYIDTSGSLNENILNISYGSTPALAQLIHGDAQVTGNITASAFSNIGGTPSLATSTGAGTGATKAIVGSDSGGVITVTTGTLPSTNALIATVTYATAVQPYCTIVPGNAVTAALSGTSMVYVTSNSANFTLTSGTVALTGATTYKWNYTCNK